MGKEQMRLFIEKNPFAISLNGSQKKMYSGENYAIIDRIRQLPMPLWLKNVGKLI
jgi:hypothetical protein